MTSSEVLDPILFNGSWTDPSTGLKYDEKLTEAGAAEWRAWLPNFIAVIDSGLYDDHIYEIAARCHARHLATGGSASVARPAPPTNTGEMFPLESIPGDRVLQAGDIVPMSDGVRGRSFVAFDQRYSRTRLTGRFFISPPSWGVRMSRLTFRIEDIVQVGAAGHFKARIVSKTHPDDPTHKPGDVIDVEFASVRHLFRD